MSNQGWQTVTNKKNKVKQVQEPVFNPIIARQKESLAKLHADKLVSKEINYDGSIEPNQDWNYVTLNKYKPKEKIALLQKTHTTIKESYDSVVNIKKVSKSMGQNVINARVYKKWTQKQLAHNATVDVKTINDIERGGILYDPIIFNKICKALGVNIERNYDLM
jgi:DNA-binding XRE family transcriptional regulator